MRTSSLQMETQWLMVEGEAISGRDVILVQDRKNDGFQDLLSRSPVHTSVRDGETTMVAHQWKEAKP